MMNIMNKTELKSILDAPPSCIIWKRTVGGERDSGPGYSVLTYISYCA